MQGRASAYEECESVEDERHVELRLASLVVLRQGKWVRVDQLSLLPTSPVPHAFPHYSQSAGNHHVPEDAVQHQRPLRQVVSVDIDAGEPARHGIRRDPTHPVPLPSPSNRVEALLRRQEEMSMFAQVDQGKHDTNRKENAKCDAWDGAAANALLWSIAGCRVEECAVGQEMRGEWLEGEEAVRPV